jgi:hypothetical protein
MGEGKLKDLMGEPSAVFRSVNLDFNENGSGGEKTAPGLSCGKMKDTGNENNCSLTRVNNSNG